VRVPWIRAGGLSLQWVYMERNSIYITASLATTPSLGELDVAHEAARVEAGGLLQRLLHLLLEPQHRRVVCLHRVLRHRAVVRLRRQLQQERRPCLLSQRPARHLPHAPPPRVRLS
jgi:hypothetical protein